MNLGFRPVSRSQKENNDFLRDGVVGVSVTQAGFKNELRLTAVQEQAMQSILDIATRANLFIGTIEVYENGALNVFLKNKVTAEVEGYARFR